MAHIPVQKERQKNLQPSLFLTRGLPSRVPLLETDEGDTVIDAHIRYGVVVIILWQWNICKPAISQSSCDIPRTKHIWRKNSNKISEILCTKCNICLDINIINRTLKWRALNISWRVLCSYWYLLPLKFQLEARPFNVVGFREISSDNTSVVSYHKGYRLKPRADYVTTTVFIFYISLEL